MALRGRRQVRGIEKIERVGQGVSHLQLRRPPAYCVQVAHPTGPRQDEDIFGVGRLTEIECPATAYAGEPQPDVGVPFRSLNPGTSSDDEPDVFLTAVGEMQTRVVVKADMDVACACRYVHS